MHFLCKCCLNLLRNIYKAQKVTINVSYPSFTEKLLWELLKPGDGELLTYVASGHGEHWIYTQKKQFHENIEQDEGNEHKSCKMNRLLTLS